MLINNRMSLYSKIYKQKVKKPRDPSLPPPENLFSQGKKIRDLQSVLDEMKAIIVSQSEQISALRRAVNQNEYRIELLNNIIRHTKKND